KVTIQEGKAEMVVKLWDRDPVPKEWMGQVIYLCCKGGNNKWGGLKIREDNYKGKTSKIINASEVAEISLKAPEGGDDAPPSQELARRTEAPQSTPAPAPAKPAKTPAPAKTPEPKQA